MQLLSNQTKAAGIVLSITVTLATYTVAGGHKTGFTAINGASQHGRGAHLRIIEPKAHPQGTPRGHHYGWEKGKHNPHHSSEASPTPGASPSNG